MTTVGDITRFLFSLAPEYMKENWDNVGLVVGRADRPVTRLLVALDASVEVLREAADLDCQLVVTHHPVIFGGLKQLNEDTVTGRAVLFAAENRIACVNMHTNLDSVRDGVNDILARRLGLSAVELVAPRGTDGSGNAYGYLRCGTVEGCGLNEFALFVKNALACPGVRYSNGGRPVRKVAVGGGACGDETAAAIQAGCDTVVTADLKYHQFCDGANLGINLIDAGHFETEAPVCGYLSEMLRAQFPDIRVILSQKQKSPIEFL